ncbi:polyketide antibiotic transporter [Nocardioides sp.]|uniref:ABC transporter permease n=1 Tax=Nocardioides sp. TaxID=35761 RepID=UPI002605CB67|nr:polyketide antibiotic transporter [Nocardioides sp.]MDI6908265.1 polyketide antibiotic transporter [Nocardioides sp.]
MTGTLVLLRAFLRRDRWMYLWWPVGIVILYVSQGWSVDGLYRTQEEFDKAAAGMEGNAALIAMAGPARALNTTGGQVAWQAAAFGAILVGLMSMFLIGRHTRSEEESGRDELLRAAPVGRYAALTAAVLDAALANLVVGLLTAGSLAAYGLAVADSLGLGLGLTACGWLFTGTALLGAQLTTSTRAAYGLAGTVIGLAYALRAFGDVSTAALSWLSPIGWYQAMHAFSGLRWWPAVLLLVGTVAGLAAAYAVFDRRDYGSGVLPARPGPARAGRGLSTGLGLAWRLQRPAVLAWTLGLLLGGLGFGTMGDDIGDLIGDSGTSRDLMLQGSTDLVDGFYATLMLMLALLAAGFSISSSLRPHGEENAGRVETLLATALRRSTWLGGHVVVTVAGTVATMAAAGLGLGTSYALVTGDGDAVLRMTWQVLSLSPAVLVLSGFARLVHGALPRAVLLSWLALLLACVVLFFGELFQLPRWFQDLSPFEHLALVPLEPFRWGPFVALTAVAAALSVAGQIAFRRRDVH